MSSLLKNVIVFVDRAIEISGGCYFSNTHHDHEHGF